MAILQLMVQNFFREERRTVRRYPRFELLCPDFFLLEIAFFECVICWYWYDRESCMMIFMLDSSPVDSCHIGMMVLRWFPLPCMWWIDVLKIKLLIWSKFWKIPIFHDPFFSPVSFCNHTVVLVLVNILTISWYIWRFCITLSFQYVSWGLMESVFKHFTWQHNDKYVCWN